MNNATVTGAGSCPKGHSLHWNSDHSKRWCQGCLTYYPLADMLTEDYVTIYACFNCGQESKSERFQHKPGCMGRNLNGSSAVRPLKFRRATDKDRCATFDCDHPAVRVLQTANPTAFYGECYVHGTRRGR